MSEKRNRRRRLALKCLLAVIGFSFFAAQLSYKFYVYSSRPVFRAAEKMASSGPSTTGHLISPKHHGGSFLSLDKRYDNKHIYDLYIPPSLVIFHPSRVEPVFSVSCNAAVSGGNLYISPRGPPLS